MIFVQSARIARGPIKAHGLMPDPDNEGEMKPTEIELDVVICNLNLGSGGDLEFAVDPELAEKIGDAFTRKAQEETTGKIVPADLSQMPKAPFGKRDGVPQQPR